VSQPGFPASLLGGDALRHLLDARGAFAKAANIRL